MSSNPENRPNKLIDSAVDIKKGPIKPEILLDEVQEFFKTHTNPGERPGLIRYGTLTCYHEMEDKTIKINITPRRDFYGMEYFISVEGIESECLVSGKKIIISSKVDNKLSFSEIKYGGENPTSPLWSREANVNEFEEYVDLIERMEKGKTSFDTQNIDYNNGVIVRSIIRK